MDNHSHEKALESRKDCVASRWRAVAGAVVATAVLGGCANMGRTDQDIVAERAQQRWNLLAKGDYVGAYAYISPSGRGLVKQDAYIGMLRRDFWTGAKVGKTECATKEACEVEVLVEYQHRGVPMRSPVREKWVREGSNWWFVLER
jgi:hypothetical protein